MLRASQRLKNNNKSFISQLCLNIKGALGSFKTPSSIKPKFPNAKVPI